VGTSAVVTVNALPGTTTYVLTVTDASGLQARAETLVTVKDGVPPALRLARDRLTVIQPTASATGARVDLTHIAFAVDVCDANPHISNDAPVLFPIGETRVTFTAADHSGNSSTKQLDVRVVYEFEGFGPPLERGDTDDDRDRDDDRGREEGGRGGKRGDAPVFRSGSTIPVTFRVRAGDGTVVRNAVAELAVYLARDTWRGSRLDPIQPASIPGKGSGAGFRFSSRSGEYVYELDTKAYAPGEYVLQVRLNDGTRYATRFVIR
jgi:hypothetical protein